MLQPGIVAVDRAARRAAGGEFCLGGSDRSDSLAVMPQTMPQLTMLVATRNAHKVREIQAILGDTVRYLSLRDFPEAPAADEDESSFAGNAAKKAGGLARWLQGRPDMEFRIPGVNAYVLADDSGLEVDALQGAPGVHSARFAHLDESGRPPAGSGNAPDAENNARLLRLLHGVPEERRTARFRCVLSLVRVKPPQPALAGQLFEGVCEGRIDLAARGTGGFGYDPLFIPAGHARSFAELGTDEKNRISHRAQALARLRQWLTTLGQL